MDRIRPRFSNLLGKLKKFFRKVPNFHPISELSLSSGVKNSKFAQNRKNTKVQKWSFKLNSSKFFKIFLLLSKVRTKVPGPKKSQIFQFWANFFFNLIFTQISNGYCRAIISLKRPCYSSFEPFFPKFLESEMNF